MELAYTWRGLFSEFYGIFGGRDELARIYYITQALHDNNLDRHQSFQIRLWLGKNRSAIVWSACDNST